MKLNDIYALGGEPMFGAQARWQNFSKDWFERIVELQTYSRELDEDALANAGRLTATEIIDMGDGSGEYHSRVAMLALDGQPFALHGTGGENAETHYLLVTDEARYEEAEAHVRSFIKPLTHKPYEVAGADDDRSLEELFGFYYQDMADAIRVRVQETFGAQAAPVLGDEAQERAEGYLLTRGSNVLHDPTPDQRRLILAGYKLPGEPAPYLRRGGTLLERMGIYDGPEVANWKASLTDILEWWMYRPVTQVPQGATVTRV
jgi:hypothetical protein